MSILKSLSSTLCAVGYRKTIASTWLAARFGLVTANALWLTACTDGIQRTDTYATKQGFQADIVPGSPFRHRVYRAHADSRYSNGVLHVYIEGDGSPFIERTEIASDPTPRDPLMLRLMALDPAPSVYLGRPCYLGFYRDGKCSPIYWTLRRFAPEVVDSMETVLLSEERRSGATQIELYGHSGGGTLAVLLAERVADVTRVVTIGPNLDVNAWCALHDYTQLTGSLNPAQMQWRRTPPQMLHLVGTEDRNTPPDLVEMAARSGAGGTVRLVDGYTHTCCWQKIWPTILRDIQTQDCSRAQLRTNSSRTDTSLSRSACHRPPTAVASGIAP